MGISANSYTPGLPRRGAAEVVGAYFLVIINIIYIYIIIAAEQLKWAELRYYEYDPFGLQGGHPRSQKTEGKWLKFLT